MLNALQKAYVRHAIVAELDRKERDRDVSGKLKTKVLSDRAFSELIGVHYKTIQLWKKRQDVQDAVRQGLEEAETSRDYFLLCMRHRAMEELWLNYSSAKGAEKRQYLRMVLEETKDVEEATEAVCYEDMTDEDLVATCLKREVSPVGMTHAELVSLSKRLKGAEDDGSQADR